MVKITFEFESVEEAYRFLKTVDYDGAKFNPPTPRPLPGSTHRTLEDDEAVDKMEAEAKPLSARERRLANKRDKKPGSPIKSGSRKKSTTKRKTTSRSKKTIEPVSDEITDADLARAASNGAEEIGPKLVTEILEQFGVGNVSELKGSQRKEFIELLNSETK